MFFPEQTVLHYCSEGQKLIILSNVLLGEMHTLRVIIIFGGGGYGDNPPLALVWGVWSPMRPTEIGKFFEIVT